MRVAGASSVFPAFPAFRARGQLVRNLRWRRQGVSDEGMAHAQSFPVGVVTARERVSGNRWITERWRVVGVVPGGAAAGRTGRQLAYAGADGEQYLWGGFAIRLNETDADAYYYNLVGQNPSVQVICERADNGELLPRVTTVDYIDAMSFREAEYEVHAVPMPPELYVWVERYVLDHYVPEEKPLRRKRDGREGEGRRR